MRRSIQPCLYLKSINKTSCRLESSTVLNSFSRHDFRERFTENVAKRLDAEDVDMYVKKSAIRKSVPDSVWIGSSVLVLLVERPSAVDINKMEPWVLLTRRAFRLRAHPGEISFPGGKLEAGETAEQAALREAHEEIALDPSWVDMLGRLRPMYTRKNAVVVGSVGVLKDVSHLDDLLPSNEEVQTIFLAPVSELVTSIRHTQFRYTVRENSNKLIYLSLPVFFTNHFHVISQSGRHGCKRLPRDAHFRVWGVTGLILYEALCCLLGRLSVP